MFQLQSYNDFDKASTTHVTMVPLPVMAEEPKKKNPRGRPRLDGRPAGSVPKVATPTKRYRTVSTDATVAPETKRGRGRPRKVRPTSENSGVEDNIVVVSQTAPRASPEQLDKLDIETNQSKEEPVRPSAAQTAELERQGKLSIFWRYFPEETQDSEKSAEQEEYVDLGQIQNTRFHANELQERTNRSTTTEPVQEVGGRKRTQAAGSR